MGQLQGSSIDRRLFNALGAAHGRHDLLLRRRGRGRSPTPTVGRRRTSRPWPRPSRRAWGANMVSTHLHFWPYSCRPGSGAGPSSASTPSGPRRRERPTSTSPWPGSDGALALGLLHVIFAEGLEDAEFLAERTIGADELRARAMEWPVARAARATGLSADAITDLARRLAAARPAFIKLGPGAQRHADAGQAFRAVLCLPAVTGAWRYAGGGAHVHSARTFPRPERLERPTSAPTAARPGSSTRCSSAGAGRHVRRRRPDRRACIANTNPAVVNPDPARPGRAGPRGSLHGRRRAVHDRARPATPTWCCRRRPSSSTSTSCSRGAIALTLNQPAIAARAVAAEHRDLPPHRRRDGPRPPRFPGPDEALSPPTRRLRPRRRRPALGARVGQDPARGGPGRRPCLARRRCSARPGPGAGRPRCAA
jgi:hypothetical protein